MEPPKGFKQWAVVAICGWMILAGILAMIRHYAKFGQW